MISVSNTSITDLYVGTQQVSAAFLGTTQVYPNAQPHAIIGSFDLSPQDVTQSVNVYYDGLNEFGSSVFTEPITTTIDGSNFYADIPINGSQSATINRMLFNSVSTPTNVLYSPITRITRLEISPISCSSMFVYMPYLMSINLNYLDTSAVTSMGGMFNGCESLTAINAAALQTSTVTDMMAMFKGCSSLTSLDLSSFYTSSVTDMHQMFESCTALTSLDISTFDTSSVTDMHDMFSGCSSLTSLNLSSFATQLVTRTDYMFADCSSLTSLDIANFNTSNVTKMSGMFAGCTSLTSLNISNFDTSSATNVNIMFQNVPSNCTITMNNVSNSTFNTLTDYQTTALDTSIIIIRDGSRYTYDSTEDKWVANLLYVPVQYIENDTNLQTGLWNHATFTLPWHPMPTSSHKIVVDMVPISAGAQYYGWSNYFGGNTNNQRHMANVFGICEQNHSRLCFAPYTQPAELSNVSSYYNQHFVIEMSNDAAQNNTTASRTTYVKLTIDGVEKLNTTVNSTTTYPPYSSDYDDYFIFGAPIERNNNYFAQMHFRLYSFDIYDNNVLTYKLRPYYYTVDNQYGMLDELSGTFYPSINQNIQFTGPQV